ncbi:hypothetical protein [Escherichia phage vB_EcoM_EP57]|nr:hypothetical protein [Escherichia phage vB_EcoM_EP57]
MYTLLTTIKGGNMSITLTGNEIFELFEMLGLNYTIRW